MGAETWDRNTGEWGFGGNKIERKLAGEVEEGEEKDEDGESELGDTNGEDWSKKPELGDIKPEETSEDAIPEDADIRDLPELGEMPVIPDQGEQQREDEEAVIREEILKKMNKDNSIPPLPEEPDIN